MYSRSKGGISEMERVLTIIVTATEFEKCLDYNIIPNKPGKLCGNHSNGEALSDKQRMFRLSAHSTHLLKLETKLSTN